MTPAERVQMNRMKKADMRQREDVCAFHANEAMDCVLNFIDAAGPHTQGYLLELQKRANEGPEDYAEAQEAARCIASKLHDERERTAVYSAAMLWLTGLTPSANKED